MDGWMDGIKPSESNFSILFLNLSNLEKLIFPAFFHAGQEPWRPVEELVDKGGKDAG